MYKFKKDYFPEINISWADAISKIDEDVISGFWGYTQKPMLENFIPTIIGEGTYRPPSFLPICEKVYKDYRMKCLHTYVSYSLMSETFGRHNDNTDVLIVQAIGETSYGFDDGKEYRLTPGDAIYIPEGVYHNPKGHCPRVSLSFSGLQL